MEIWIYCWSARVPLLTRQTLSVLLVSSVRKLGADDCINPRSRGSITVQRDFEDEYARWQVPLASFPATGNGEGGSWLMARELCVSHRAIPSYFSLSSLSRTAGFCKHECYCSFLNFPSRTCWISWQSLPLLDFDFAWHHSPNSDTLTCSIALC